MTGHFLDNPQLRCYYVVVPDLEESELICYLRLCRLHSQLDILEGQKSVLQKKVKNNN